MSQLLLSLGVLLSKPGISGTSRLPEVRNTDRLKASWAKGTRDHSHLFPLHFPLQNVQNRQIWDKVNVRDTGTTEVGTQASRTRRRYLAREEKGTPCSRVVKDSACGENTHWHTCSLTHKCIHTHM